MLTNIQTFFAGLLKIQPVGIFFLHNELVEYTTGAHLENILRRVTKIISQHTERSNKHIAPLFTFAWHEDMMRMTIRENGGKGPVVSEVDLIIDKTETGLSLALANGSWDLLEKDKWTNLTFVVLKMRLNPVFDNLDSSEAMLLRDFLRSVQKLSAIMRKQHHNLVFSLTIQEKGIVVVAEHEGRTITMFTLMVDK